MLRVKQSARWIIVAALRLLVKIKLGRTHPHIVGITGSIGKTSTKEAVYHVLSERYRTYRSAKSLNTDIGLLLSVLEQNSGFSSPIAWAQTLLGGLWNAFFGRRYEYLVLEYGADKPGDISELLSVVKPHIAIITHVTLVHQAEGQFKNEEAVFNEKKKLVTRLGAQDFAILNRADPFLQKLKGTLKAKTSWFGRGTNEKDIHNDIWASDLKLTEKGFGATIHTLDGESHGAHFPITGTYHIDLFLPALLVGQIAGISLQEGIHALENKYRLPPGRMSIIEGIEGSTLLDSSYNSSPEAVREALKLLHTFPGERKIAVLGTMNELGESSHAAHQELADHLGTWLELLVTVGEGAAEIAHAALKKGFKEDKIATCTTAISAAALLQKYGVEKGDVILFKGSQNKVRLERAVKLLMAHPHDAAKLLCRQETVWDTIE